MFDFVLGWAMDRDADRLMTDKIKAFKGLPYAQMPDAAVYQEQYELAGFKFVKFTIIANVNINNHGGSKLRINTPVGAIVFTSEDEDVYTYYSDKMQIGLTRAEFDLTPELEALLASTGKESITFMFKGASVHFTNFCFDGTL
jgi:hypothetical protein